MKKQYLDLTARMEELIQKGTKLGGMDFLSDEEKTEFQVVSNAVYELECQMNAHPWKTKSPIMTPVVKHGDYTKHFAMG